MDKNIVAFIRDDVRTVDVRFICDNFAQKSNEFKNSTPTLLSEETSMLLPNLDLTIKTYTYLTDLTDLNPGDFAVVLAQGVPKVVYISAVHDEVEIEPNSDVEYKWIVSKVDLAHFEKLSQQNLAIKETLTKAHRSHVKKSFAQILLASCEEGDRLKIESILKGDKK